MALTYGGLSAEAGMPPTGPTAALADADDPDPLAGRVQSEGAEESSEEEDAPTSEPQPSVVDSQSRSNTRHLDAFADNSILAANHTIAVCSHLLECPVSSVAIVAKHQRRTLDVLSPSPMSINTSLTHLTHFHAWYSAQYSASDTLPRTAIRGSWQQAVWA
jgi:hypothetical protein